jgi:hypothetical protein
MHKELPWYSLSEAVYDLEAEQSGSAQGLAQALEA